MGTHAEILLSQDKREATTLTTAQTDLEDAALGERCHTRGTYGLHGQETPRTGKLRQDVDSWGPGLGRGQGFLQR